MTPLLVGSCHEARIPSSSPDRPPIERPERAPAPLATSSPRTAIQEAAVVRRPYARPAEGSHVDHTDQQFRTPHRPDGLPAGPGRHARGRPHQGRHVAIWYIVIIAAELVVVVLIGAYIRASQKHSTD
ncbi:hypothetical protein [Raineyella sp. LH-20]|uniref:hypothetical protein n=1 Tax=Raineyella sp. LH-20 TaxID=3081204 RepID=UPI002954D960|nr:hypothetical protein [Raineyella sp. LH-20]WOP19534.1 hypothetical protein R0146_04460 [Raineyella sp. LH-20]